MVFWGSRVGNPKNKFEAYETLRALRLIEPTVAGVSLPGAYGVWYPSTHRPQSSSFLGFIFRIL